MSDELFRSNSLNKIKSPDDLNDYVRVANPGIWMVLVAVVVLLVGVCIWSIFGRIETKVPVKLFANNGEVICSVVGDNSKKIEPGMVVETEESNGKVISVDNENVSVDISLPNGTYNANIITEKIKPISFVFN